MTSKKFNKGWSLHDYYCPVMWGSTPSPARSPKFELYILDQQIAALKTNYFGSNQNSISWANIRAEQCSG